MTWVSAQRTGQARHKCSVTCSCSPTVPELAARGIIQQVFPVHEQRILNRLMKSWVQAVCENQPLGVTPGPEGVQESQEVGSTDQDPLAPLTDEICDYFGVKIAMYFAWLGFYTSAMVYPAVFGSVLYTFTEADQVLGAGRAGTGSPKTPFSLGRPGQQLSLLYHPRQAGMCHVWSSRSSMWSGQHCSWRNGNRGGQSWPTSGGRWTPLAKL